MGKLHDIRQRRLRELIRERYHNRQKDFADAIGRDANYVSRMLSKGESRKRIGEDLAREIEQLCDLPKRWLDDDASPDTATEVREPPTQYGLELTPTALTIARTWDQLPSSGQEMVATMMLQMVRFQQEDPDVAARVFTVPDAETIKRLREHERQMERVQRELRAKAVKHRDSRHDD